MDMINDLRHKAGRTGEPYASLMVRAIDAAPAEMIAPMEPTDVVEWADRFVENYLDRALPYEDINQYVERVLTYAGR